MMSESQNGGDCMEDRSRQRDQHVRMISDQINALELERGILRMCVSAEERRSLEGVYKWRSSERYCGPVPVNTLKQSVEILYCIRALIDSQCND